MNSIFNSGVILCYNSRNRYKVCFNSKKQVIELYQLNDNTLWDRFDYFECENMSQDEIIEESKKLINVWQGEPSTEIHHMTEIT